MTRLMKSAALAAGIGILVAPLMLTGCKDKTEPKKDGDEKKAQPAAPKKPPVTKKKKPPTKTKDPAKEPAKDPVDEPDKPIVKKPDEPVKPKPPEKKPVRLVEMIDMGTGAIVQIPFPQIKNGEKLSNGSRKLASGRIVAKPAICDHCHEKIPPILVERTPDMTAAQAEAAVMKAFTGAKCPKCKKPRM